MTLKCERNKSSTHQELIKLDQSIEKYKRITAVLERVLKWKNLAKALGGTLVPLFAAGPPAFGIALGVVLTIFLIEKLLHVYFVYKLNQSVERYNSLTNSLSSI